ncbi:hypothetical protein [Yinghuangia seranimata]|uniref:hypothetical protein n=1 Tax=Yinghuangia seranimata TaxID=408067 RepID=UPI00248BC76E|nr:hypothetical protein [Yinghuangia seranimata]MDI2131801.1 hypothetical protein [Yinghuangia seranimata]
MPAPLDEFPVHQTPLSIARVASSDRNFYDRYYFNGHDRTGDVFLITGFGVYPNLGVKDAFVTVGRGSRHTTVRLSDAFDAATDDRLNPAVGGYRIEVKEPLNELRVVSETAEHGIAMDLTWRGSFPAIDEEPHVLRRDGRVILDAQRFAQLGTWEGTLVVEGTEYTVTPDTWVGSRDRSWGIRPSGEAEPGGRAAAERDPSGGMWWTYVPLRFDDFAIVVIVQEEPDGTRTLNQATRVWPAETGRRPEQLGWPEFDIEYASGTRMPVRATLRMKDLSGKPVVVDVEPLGHIALNCGPGYGMDPTWTHGQWRGRDWAESVVVDLAEDEAAAGRAKFSLLDHVARATCDGAEGWGLFEHGVLGRHDPSGFADFLAVAP